MRWFQHYYGCWGLPEYCQICVPNYPMWWPQNFLSISSLCQLMVALWDTWPERVGKGIIAYKCPISHPSNFKSFDACVVVGRFVSNDMDYTNPGSSKLIMVLNQLELIATSGMLNISHVLCWMNESSLSKGHPHFLLAPSWLCNALSMTCLATNLKLSLKIRIQGQRRELTLKTQSNLPQNTWRMSYQFGNLINN